MGNSYATFHFLQWTTKLQQIQQRKVRFMSNLFLLWSLCILCFLLMTVIIFIECDQALWISFKRYILKLFRKEVEEDLPSNSNSETGTRNIHEKMIAFFTLDLFAGYILTMYYIFYSIFNYFYSTLWHQHDLHCIKLHFFLLLQTS